MEKKVIYEKIENKYIDDLSVEDIYFVSFAEGGAMGDGGAVCLISLEDDNIIIRSGNYVYGDLDINKLADKFSPLEKIYSKDKFKDWSYEYMGAGNHLLIRNDVYFVFMCKVDPSTVENMCSASASLSFKKIKRTVKKLINPMYDIFNLYQNYLPCAIETLKFI